MLEARPNERRVIVENLNMIKRHTARGRCRTRAAWAPADDPGRHHREGVAGARLERDGHLPDLQAADPRRHRPAKEVKDKTIRVRVCRRADCGQEIDR